MQPNSPSHYPPSENEIELYKLVVKLTNVVGQLSETNQLMREAINELDRRTVDLSHRLQWLERLEKEEEDTLCQNHPPRSTTIH